MLRISSNQINYNVIYLQAFVYGVSEWKMILTVLTTFAFDVEVVNKNIEKPQITRIRRIAPRFFQICWRRLELFEIHQKKIF